MKHGDFRKQFDEIERETDNALHILNNYIALPQVQILQNSLKIYELEFESKIKKIDIQISIVQNLIGFILALLIAIASFDSVKVNLYPPLIAFVLGLIYLAIVIYQRQILVDKLEKQIKENSVKINETLINFTKRNIDQYQHKSKLVHEMLDEVNQEVDKIEKSL